MEVCTSKNIDIEITSAVEIHKKELDKLVYVVSQNRLLLGQLSSELRIQRTNVSNPEASGYKTLELQDLSALKAQIMQERRRKHVIAHMNDSTTDSRNSTCRENLVLQRLIRQEKIKAQQMVAAEKRKRNELTHNQKVCAAEKERLHRKLGTFFEKLNLHENYFAEEKKFITAYNHSIKSYDIMYSDNAMIAAPSKSLSKKYSALFKVKTIENKLARTLQSTLEEEHRYEDAFKIIGIKLGEVDTSSLVKLCLHHESVLQHLSDRAKSQREKNETLTAKLATAASLLQSEFYGTNRKTNRDVLKMEQRLSQTKKELEEELNEYQYIRKYLTPCIVKV